MKYLDNNLNCDKFKFQYLALSFNVELFATLLTKDRIKIIYLCKWLMWVFSYLLNIIESIRLDWFNDYDKIRSLTNKYDTSSLHGL